MGTDTVDFMDLNGKDRRTEKRHPCKVLIEYSFAPEDCPSKGPWENYTTDLSFNGMGFQSKCPAKVGQKMMVLLKYVFEAPRIAEVRWCVKLDNNKYRIGVQYSNSAG
jgi:hypothetical protein